MTASPSIRLSLIARREQTGPRAPSVPRALPQPEGRGRAVDELLEEHVESVFRYALRLTRDREHAWDVTQETLLRGWQRRRHLREPASARVWLLRIATNIFRDQLRRPAIGGVLTIEPSGPEDSTELRAAQKEDVARALAALDELPTRQRQVMHLITIEQLPHQQAAAVLGISIDAVKSNLAVARKTMRLKLKDLYDEIRGVRSE